MVLAGKAFEATKSTHGRYVWSLDTTYHKTEKDLSEIRETLLWDLAGQAEFRLVHQLSLDQTSVALVLFDGSSPTDPFKGVTFWNKALQQAKGSKHLVKYLVAARTDVSSLNVTEERMNTFALEQGFQAAFRTSAATGLGIMELLQQVEKAINWERLPLTVSESLFKQMKDFIVEQKQKDFVLETSTSLMQQFQKAFPKATFEDEEFQAALGRVEAHDLVKVLSFGDYVLLQSELLDNYASAMARAAREQPDGLGFLDEQAARQGQFKFGSLERVQEDDERIILQSVIELFIEKELAIVDEGKLIFPSQFNRELPEHPEVQGTTVSYQFEGALLNAYTTLVVRLYHSEAFNLESLWKNAALFLPFGLKGETKRCGYILKEPEEGTGLLTVFFGVNVPDETKILFLKYVHEHLRRKVLNGKVTRERIYRCQKCQQEVVDRKAVKLAIENGRSTIPCLYCYPLTDILLTDLIEETFGKDDEFLAKVRKMDDQIDVRLDNDSKDTILKGEVMALVGKAAQIFRLLPSDDWGIDGEIEFKDDKGQACGVRIYVQLKSGASYLKTRKDGVRTFHIPKKRHIEYWQSHQYPVYLIIRDRDEKMYWMNITEHLTTRVDKTARTIIFDGEELTLQAIKALRETRLSQAIRVKI
jgi:GTPase SAR1 family protein